ncbi:MAG: L-threonylcarbamoyladenylate synthase [Candidatus Bathyarchaeia archaeon]
MARVLSGQRAVEEGARILREGGVLIYPTDTVYGLGCDPFRPEAVERVFRIKGERSTPVPILIDDPKRLRGLAEVDEAAEELMRRFWPGPLTLVLRNIGFPPRVTCGGDTVGVRIPDNPIALSLISKGGGFLVGTSANRSGHPPCLTAEEALERLGDEVDLIIDGGRAALAVGSTVVDLSSGEPRLLRPGPVDWEAIRAAMRPAGSADDVGKPT